MRFVLTVDMDNAAFEDAPGYELSRILGQVHHQAQTEGARAFMGAGMFLRDSNGNTVGEARIERGE